MLYLTMSILTAYKRFSRFSLLATNNVAKNIFVNMSVLMFDYFSRLDSDKCNYLVKTVHVNL